MRYKVAHTAHYVCKLVASAPLCQKLLNQDIIYKFKRIGSYKNSVFFAQFHKTVGAYS